MNPEKTDHETIVAVYDSVAEANATVRDLKAAGVPGGAITEHAKQEAADEVTADTNPLHWHFWARQLGFEPTPEQEHEAQVYHHSVESGATVVAVRGADAVGIDVVAILERHNPVDLDARAVSLGAPASGTVENRGTARIRRYGPGDTTGT